MPRPRALITANFSKSALEKLSANLDVIYRPWGETKRVLSEVELAEALRSLGAEILVVELEHVSREVLEGANLKLVGICRNDPRRSIDLEAARARSVPVIYTPGRNYNAVAELTIAVMLALLRKVVFADRLLRSGRVFISSTEDFTEYYNTYRGWELQGKTVGIIGLGKIGFRVAQLLRAFDVKILVYDPYVSEERVSSVGGERVELETLLRNSDIVTVHAPPSPETAGMIDKREIELMKPTAFLLNLANPVVVDEDALYEALKNKRIAGAALDVFTEEPVDSTNRFLEFDNVVVTPHIGGDTFETIERQSLAITEDILRFLRGERPRFLLNPEVWRNGS
jgi:D-3-phosphoglycerate dehydrogenase